LLDLKHFLLPNRANIGHREDCAGTITSNFFASTHRIGYETVNCGKLPILSP
jgi:hypothetical protein